MNGKVSKSLSEYISLNARRNNESDIKYYDFRFPKDSLKEIILGPEYANDVSFDVNQKEIEKF